MITKFQKQIFNLPDAETLQRSIEEMNRATDRIAAEREQMGIRSRGGFGKQIVCAVRARQQPRFRVTASAAANEDESFAEKVKRAVEKKRAKPAKTDGDRYLLTRRERSRSE